MLETRRGTIIDYLDYLEENLSRHILHRNLVSSEHRSKQQYHRNSRPRCVEDDIDFSENGNIANFDKVQSEHWVTIQYTLMMSIILFLLADEWNKTTGELTKGDEVTVNGELAGDDINMESYWAVVKQYTKDDNGVETVTVEDAEGNITTQPRSLLRHRKRHTICVAHLSDDKKHDRFAMQHYTEAELPWLEKYMQENFPNDLDDGCDFITRFHRHSDIACQHFQNTGAIESFTSLVKKHGRDASKCKYVYSFGAPGHGKGCFDGLGGTFKNKVHSLIKSTKTSGQGIPGVESGYIGSVDEVFQALQHNFTGAAADARRKSGKEPD